jgi:hypothetical protein
MFNARSATSNAVESEGSGCCLVPLFLVLELVGSRRFWCNSVNPIIMVVREICPPLVQMI